MCLLSTTAQIPGYDFVKDKTYFRPKPSCFLFVINFADWLPVLAFLLLGLKRPDLVAYDPHPSRVEFKNQWSFVSNLPTRLHGMQSDFFMLSTKY